MVIRRSHEAGYRRQLNCILLTLSLFSLMLRTETGLHVHFVVVISSRMNIACTSLPMVEQSL